MDEDYARRLRNWLRTEPGTTPRQAEEEREWLRRIPQPGSAADERGRLPEAGPIGDGGWRGDQRPAPSEPAADVEEAAGQRFVPPGRPQPAVDGDEASGQRPVPPEPATGGSDLPGDRLPAPQPAPDEPWSVRGRLPAAHPEADEEWICPVIALPLPRSSRENGCRMSEAEARSRRNHPTNRDRRDEAPDLRPMSEAEARSRWNHPTNWHRRRREADQQRRDHPGSR